MQANKSDTYSCIRCALKESIVRCAQVMANMSNRWSDKGAVLRARDAQIEKVCASEISVSSDLLYTRFLLCLTP